MASKTEERNALAELAVFLKDEAKPSSDDFKANLIKRLGEDAWHRLVERKRKFAKAADIIAELAKVPDCTFKGNPRVDKSADAIIACRAIAEE